MSGPKISEYVLTEEQRKILREQTKCDRDILALIKQIDEMLPKLTAQLGEVDIPDGMGSRESEEKSKELKKQLKQLVELGSALKRSFADFEDYKPPVVIVISQQELDKKTAKRDKLKGIKADMQGIFSRADKIGREGYKLGKKAAGEVMESIKKSFGLDWDWKQAPDNTQSLKSGILAGLEALFEMDIPKHLEDKVKSAIQKVKTIENEEFLKNYGALSLKPLANECSEWIKLRDSFGARFDDAYSRYTALCAVLGREQKEFTISQESCVELEAEIALMEEEILSAQEQEYISDCIDEVMEEMGYNLLGTREVVKKSGKRFRDELYSFGEGTAVNIRYDSTGKISMELGGLDTTDRVPQGSEVDKLCDEMNKFCDKFDEFEERLAKKGVVCGSRISHLPPTAEHAQIINATDFGAEVEKQKAQQERKKRRSIRKKQMKQE